MLPSHELLDNPIFQRNFVWLEDYLIKCPNVEAQVTDAVLAMVKANPGIYLSELQQKIEIASIDDFHVLILTDKIYVDLFAIPLSCPEQVQVFLSATEAFTHSQLTTIVPSNWETFNSPLNVAIGTQISWDGQPWTIVNLGNNYVGLQGENNTFQHLPNSVFSTLVHQEKIVGLSSPNFSSLNPKIEEIFSYTSQADLQEAHRRYQQIEAFLKGTASTPTNRTQRRWLASYRKAEQLYGRGFIGLIPQHRHKGNSLSKMDKDVHQLMEKHIQEEYETHKQPSIRHAFQAFKELCAHTGLRPPSLETYRRSIRNRPVVEQVKKRQGSRAAYQEETFYEFLDRNTPIHGERPFEIAHIDHTLADVQLLSLIMLNLGMEMNEGEHQANLGKAWVTLLIDAYSRRILAAYMTFDSPSYRSNMMVLRICVQRFGRLPQILVVDGGRDFQSGNFEMLLAYSHVTKKERANTRDGSVIESFFGVADREFWHNLKGNTQIMKKVRQVTKSVNPKYHAVWTLDKLYRYFCEYCYEIYDTCPHPTLRMTPREAFEIGLARGGLRGHLLIPYEEFKLLSLPAPTDNDGMRRITPKGIKINYLYYGHPSFERVRNTRVAVKYEPFDVTIAYAYIKGEWVQCRSGYIRELQGRSVKELITASDELKKLNQLQNQQFSDITGKNLAQFFTRIEREEAILTPSWREAKKAVQAQHLRDEELKEVLNEIEGKPSTKETSNDSSEIDLFTFENREYIALSSSISPPSPIQQTQVDEDDDNDEFEELFEPLEEW
ncbi:DNA-binding domain-containing protein [Gloeothece verrucosa]|uniref:DNA-binding domain-containing protein n=1 Tax=Gloeothece verrucosa TaxID=2546359 RepID=UPI0002F08469|nr:DNA-binding domain-containing protein [Gloeothece verrucosa]